MLSPSAANSPGQPRGKVVFNTKDFILSTISSIRLWLLALLLAVAGGNAAAQQTVSPAQKPVSQQKPVAQKPVAQTPGILLNPASKNSFSQGVPLVSGVTAQFAQTLGILRNTAMQLPPPGPASKNGVSTCGGIKPNGDLETSCAAAPAIFESAAVGTCPAGSFFDLGKWACYSCPSGYERAVFDGITDPKACFQNTFKSTLSGLAGAIQRPPPVYSTATLKGTACPAGSFFDPIRGGECFTCPAGYTRSVAHVGNADACVILASEKLVAATVGNRPRGLDCDAGQFWDPIRGGNCFSCPAGYNRTGYHVDNNQACSKFVGHSWSKSTVAGKAQCKADEFVDYLTSGKLGGNCYTCPLNARRTVFPVTGVQACETDPGYNYSEATLVSALTCPAGQIFDFAGRDTAAVLTRITTQNKAASTNGTAPKVAPTQNGGTCWSCGTEYRRSFSAVWENNACDSVGIGWVAPTYTQPGLFGLKGAQEVVLEIIANDRETIKQIALDTIDKTTNEYKANKANAEKLWLIAVWKEIAETPQESGPLMVVAYARILAAADSAKTASAADKVLLASFQDMARTQRTFLAEQALQAYTEWDAADFKRNDAYRASLIAATVLTFGVAAGPAIGVDLVKNGVYPMPDFAAITLASIAEGWVSDQTQGFIVNKVLLSDALQLKLFKHTPAQSAAARKALTETGEVFGKELSKLVTQRAAAALRGTAVATAGKATARSVAAALKVSGPQILVGFAQEAMTAWIELHIERANAGKDLEAKVAEAKRVDYDVKRLDSFAGRAQVQGEWAQMMGVARPPVNLQAIKNAVEPLLGPLAR